MSSGDRCPHMLGEWFSYNLKEGVHFPESRELLREINNVGDRLKLAPRVPQNVGQVQ